MSLVLALGSNQGNRFDFLARAKTELDKHFEFIDKSHIYEFEPVDCKNPDIFFNQVLEYKTPEQAPESILEMILSIEKNLGRVRDQVNGPRTIDIDILFIDDSVFESQLLTIPHPRWHKRSFVVYPLKELPCYQKIKETFTHDDKFSHWSKPTTLI